MPPPLAHRGLSLGGMAMGLATGSASRGSTSSTVTSPSVRRTRGSFDLTDGEAETESLLPHNNQPTPQRQRRHASAHLRQAVRKITLVSRLRGYVRFTEGSVAIFLVLAILLLLLLTIAAGLLLRPVFTLGLLAAAGASLGFVLTEARSLGAWHHNREAENRFWIGVAAITTTTFVFAPDSPLAPIGDTFPVLGIMAVMASAMWVHYYDRKLEREELGRAPHLRRVSSFILTDQEATKQKLQVVQDCLAALDYRFVAAKALNHTQIQEAELDILNLLTNCEKEELNYIVTNVNLALLFYKIKDKDIMSFNKKEVHTRTRVLELLARERLADLNIQGRVVVLDALVNLRLKAHTSAEEWVRDIILGTHGRMLTRMKNACDLKGRVHNFHKLIYRDITSAPIRAEIIAHLRREAEVVKNDGLLPRERRKILSDVDDTLFSSGGRFPAGLDTRYPHHVLYPGVCSFYKELDLGASSSSGEWEQGRQGNLAFLSARPHVYKDKSERKSYKMFEELRSMANMGLHCVPTLLSGSLDSGFQMFRGLYEPMSAKKFTNFLEYATLYPEFHFCFIGDNGQGDARAGEMIKEALPSQVEAIFIHEIQAIHKTPGYVNYESRARYEKLGVYFFTTYVGAALQACKLKMIHPNGLRRIAADAVAYFLELKATLGMPFHVLDARRTELNKDIEAANAYLLSLPMPSPCLRPSSSPLIGPFSGPSSSSSATSGPIALIPADCLFHVGSSVETAWGVGSVERFNPATGIYTVRLTEWRLVGSSVRVYMHGSEITWHTKGSVGDAVHTKFGTGILQEIRENGVHVVRLTEWGLANLPILPPKKTLKSKTTDTLKTTLQASLNRKTSHAPSASLIPSTPPYAYLQPDEFTVIVAAVRDQVRTVFGVAVVTKYRPPCTDPSHSHHAPIATNSHVVVPSPVVQLLSSAPSTSLSPPASPSSSSSSFSPPPPCTTVGIYVCSLAWHDHGGATAYLNGRAIRKIREPSQRRCAIQ